MRRHATESQEGMALKKWWDLQAFHFGYHADDLAHIPNEGKRSIYNGHNLKREGLVPGMPDYILSVPHGDFHGLWIELKSKANRQGPTQAQIKQIARLRKRGYRAEVCKGWESAQAVILDYLGKLAKEAA